MYSGFSTHIIFPGFFLIWKDLEDSQKIFSQVQRNTIKCYSLVSESVWFSESENHNPPIVLNSKYETLFKIIDWIQKKTNHTYVSDVFTR